MVSANPTLYSSLVSAPKDITSSYGLITGIGKRSPFPWVDVAHAKMPTFARVVWSGSHPPVAVLAECSCAVGNLYNHMWQSCVPRGIYVLPWPLDFPSKPWLLLFCPYLPGSRVLITLGKSCSLLSCTPTQGLKTVFEPHRIYVLHTCLAPQGSAYSSSRTTQSLNHSVPPNNRIPRSKQSRGNVVCISFDITDNKALNSHRP